MARIAQVLLLWGCYTASVALRKNSARISTPSKDDTNATDCIDWEMPHPFVCNECSAFEDDIHGGLIYRALCTSCPAGHVLIQAEDADAKGVIGTTKHEGVDVLWRQTCAPLVGQERRLIMIRHGESLWNGMMKNTGGMAGIIGTLIGKDSPLSPLGLQQAQRLAKILQKTSLHVYGQVSPSENASASDDFLQMVAARTELDHNNVEQTLKIIRTADDTLVSDEEMVKKLAREEIRDELDVLLGRKCSSTNFVTSQLARAMDTFLISTLESRLQCVAPWLISSNLQEIEHNLDCTPRAKPGMQPTMGRTQQKTYYTLSMGKTQEYVEARYKTSDVSRYERNFGQVERNRWYDQKPQMLSELESMFESEKVFNVWGGHSIWFRHFFKAFADLGSQTCKDLMSIKMANTAMVSMRLRAVDKSVTSQGHTAGYAAYDCKWLHLGSSDDYKLKLNKQDLMYQIVVPPPENFDHGVSQIMGWKCCCSRSKEKDANGPFIFNKRKSMERCVLARTDKCGTPAAWQEVWHEEDAKFIQEAMKYDWGHNKGSCTAA